MKTKVKSFKSILEESLNSPKKLIELDGVYGKTKVWLEEKPSTGEMFISVDGDCTISVDDLPKLINTLKKL